MVLLSEIKCPGELGCRVFCFINSFDNPYPPILVRVAEARHKLGKLRIFGKAKGFLRGGLVDQAVASQLTETSTNGLFAAAEQVIYRPNGPPVIRGTAKQEEHLEVLYRGQILFDEPNEVRF